MGAALMLCACPMAVAGPGSEAAPPSQLPTSASQAGGAWTTAWTTPNPGMGVRSSRARPAGAVPSVPAPNRLASPPSTAGMQAHGRSTGPGPWRVVPVPARRGVVPGTLIPARDETELPPPGGSWSLPGASNGQPGARSPAGDAKDDTDRTDGTTGASRFVETRPPATALPPYAAPANPPVVVWPQPNSIPATPPMRAMPNVPPAQPSNQAPLGSPPGNAYASRTRMRRVSAPRRSQGAPQVNRGAFRRPTALWRGGEEQVIAWGGGSTRKQGGMRPVAQDGMHFRFAVGDTVKIAVWKEKELLSEQAVLPDGTIVPPLLEPLMVKGRTISEVRADLIRGYSDHKEVGPRDVILTVSRLGVKDRAFILGEVGDSTAVELREPRTLLQVLAEAGGPVGGVSDLERIRVVRTRNRSGRPQVFRVNAKRIMQGRLSTFMIQPGDVVYVPATGTASWSRDMQMRLAPLQTLIGGAATAALAVTSTTQ